MSETKVWAGLLPFEASPLGLQTAIMEINKKPSRNWSWEGCRGSTHPITHPQEQQPGGDGAASPREVQPLYCEGRFLSPPATAQPMRNATAQPMRNVTAQPMRNATAQPTRNAAVQPMRNVTAQPMRNASAQPMRKAAAQPMRNAAAQPMRNIAAQPMRSGCGPDLLLFPQWTSLPLPFSS